MIIINLLKNFKVFTVVKSIISNLSKNKEKRKTYKIDNNYYTLFGTKLILSEATSKDLYGWSLEFKYDNSDYWSTWKNHIYPSRDIAIESAIKVLNSSFPHSDKNWRIIPLYKMDKSDYREYLIGELLIDKKDKQTYNITVWKVKEDYFLNKKGLICNFRKGTLFIRKEDGNVIMVKNKVEKIEQLSRFNILNTLISDGKVEEVDIKNEKWAHPHLCKELKEKI